MDRSGMKSRTVDSLAVVSEVARSSAANNPTAVLRDSSNNRLGLRSVDPFRCRVWILHNRLPEGISEESCAEEIESFKVHGQREPVQGRPVHDDPAYDVEVFCGARRLFVARLLRVPLEVDVREISDRDAIIAMHVSALHKKLSPYEKGLGYLEWIRSGFFKSQEDLAAALGIAPAKLSRLLKLARLPSVIVSAFGSPVDILEDWGLKLAEILEDPVRKGSAIRAARGLAAKSAGLRPEQIYQRLLISVAPSEAGRHKVVAAARDQVIKREDGTALFRIRHQRDSIALLLPIENTSTTTLDAIQRAIKNILISSKSEVASTVCDFQLGSA